MSPMTPIWMPASYPVHGIRAVSLLRSSERSARILPGLPGIAVGRTGYVAMGTTNAYGDTQDLYVETVDPKDPDRYMEGDKSLPFQIIEETLVIKDKNAPQGYREEKVKIRLTTRGPVISGVLRSLKTDKVMTLRFAPFESMDPCIGLHLILTAKSIEEVQPRSRSSEYHLPQLRRSLTEMGTSGGMFRGNSLFAPKGTERFPSW